MGEVKTKEFTLSPRHPMYNTPGFVYRRAGRPFKRGEPTVVSEKDFATVEADRFVEKFKGPKKIEPNPTKMNNAELLAHCKEKGLEVTDGMQNFEMLLLLKIDPDPTKMKRDELFAFCKSKNLELESDITIKDMLAKLGIGQK